MESEPQPTRVPNLARRFGLGILGAFIGFLIGAIVSAYAIVLFGRVLFGKDFFQIAWLIQMLGVPVGALFGAVLGVQTAVNVPRQFALTFIPISLFLLGVEVAQYHLRRVERPRTFTLSFTADSPFLRSKARALGREVTGHVVADGVSHPISGTIPATFSYIASRIKYQVELVKDEEEGEWFALDVSVEDRNVGQGVSDFKVDGEAWTRGVGWWTYSAGGYGVETVEHHKLRRQRNNAEATH